MVMRFRRWASAAAALSIAGSVAVAQAGPVSAAGQVTVHSGHSIQAAINAAAPGTTINVDQGTYRENLVIAKDGITLRGMGEAEDVRILPPTTVAPVCGETSTAVIGICVANITGFGPGGPITATVHNVRIANLTIRNFSDSGIFMFDTAGSRVDHVRAYNNGGYGVFVLQSSAPRLTDNIAAGNHEAGFYVGQSHAAAAVISGNDAHANGFGIFFRDSRGATIADNRTNGNCVGIMLLNTGSFPWGDGDVSAVGNTADRNNLECPGSHDGPPTSGLGIAVVGADHVALRDNTVDQNRNSGPTAATGGIVLIPSGPNSAPAHVTVDDNDLESNSTDIVVAVPSPANRFTENDCRTSSPAGLCET
jgi:parallel beta-helix repeat protein